MQKDSKKRRGNATIKLLNKNNKKYIIWVGLFS